MHKIQVLDCTLRDGGYVNEWLFGANVIMGTINSLVNANVDIIELGFLSSNVKFNRNTTLYSKIQDTDSLVTKDSNNVKFVLMINHGEFDLEQLEYSEHIYGIRYAFHKNDLFVALENSKLIIEKGFKLFLQPMVINAYTELELESLVSLVNELLPYAFYIVDSFGVLSPSDIKSLTIFLDKKILASIKIGFHSHNNKQLSVANSITFVSNLERDGLVDSSIYGMGRGAGNLNTEIILDFLNQYNNSKYITSKLLAIIDNYYYPLQQSLKWGYSLPYYLSAKYSLHPNYAKYLIQLDTLKIDEVEEILEGIRIDNRAFYNKNLIQQLYTDYQSSKKLNGGNNKDLAIVFNKRIVLILPGPSYITAIDKVKKISGESYSIVSVNFLPVNLDIDYVFLSNNKRLNDLIGYEKHIIKTSNVQFNFNNQSTIKYSKYINRYDYVNDNALLMFLSYLKEHNVEHIYIAGLDGYDPSISMSSTYVSNRMVSESISEKNKNIEKFLAQYSVDISISFLTESRFIKFN
jgi:4-hydroxy 2-oxovalerate aldolase